MTNEEAIQVLHHIIQVADTSDCGIKEIDGLDEEALDMAIKALEQEQETPKYEDVDVAKAFQFGLALGFGERHNEMDKVIDDIKKVIIPQSKTGHCKDCKYFEYDSVANVDGIPLIVAHEICSRWGDGCKTREDGYCFLFEPQKRSNKE